MAAHLSGRPVISSLAACAVVLFMPSILFASPSEALPAIMVLTIKNEGQAEPGLARMLTELVLQDLHDLKKFRVVGEKDISQMLSTEQKKQLAGCSDTRCLIEIAGAMGTQYTIDGTVGVVGASNLLSLTLVDVTRAAVVSRKTTVVKGEREQLLESVHKLIADLMGPVIKEEAGAPAKSTTAVKTVEYPMNPYKLWGHVSFWSGLGVAGLGGAFTAMASNANSDYKAGKDPVANRDAVGRDNAIAVTGYAVGAALMITGATLWILSPGDEAWAKEHALTIQPVIDRGATAIILSGSW